MVQMLIAKAIKNKDANYLTSIAVLLDNKVTTKASTSFTKDIMEVYGYVDGMGMLSILIAHGKITVAQAYAFLGLE